MPHLNHPTVFIWAKMYYELGVFNTDCKIAMDYEFLLRISLHGVVGILIDKNIAFMRRGGNSERAYQKTRKEVLNISLENGLPHITSWYYYFRLMAKYRIKKLFNVI